VPPHLVTVPRQVNYQNLTATNIDFSATINSGSFNVLTYIFQDTGTVVHGSEESRVGNGTMKFSVNVNNWNWCTGSNCVHGGTQQVGAFLEFDVSIKGFKSPEAKALANSNLPATNQTQDYDIGAGAVVGLSSRVEVDGVWLTMPNGYPKIAAQGASSVYTFRFPKGNSILYDPTIGPDITAGASSSSSDRSGPSGGTTFWKSGVGVVFSLGFASVAGYFGYRYCMSGSKYKTAKAKAELQHIPRQQTSISQPQSV